jgi:predicted N-acetyltransferase YhbS
MRVRTAAPSDADALTALITEAFATDPLWSWAIPDVRAMETWWRLLVTSALRYPTVWIAGDYAAAAVWIPPGGVELTHAEEERVEPLLHDLVGARAPQVVELLERFDASHPSDAPHYYLSLLATANRHRGHGLGMELLRDCLRRVDDRGVGAYLESSNPANDRRYERVGFRRTGSFSTPDGACAVATMWRDARA